MAGTFGGRAFVTEFTDRFPAGLDTVIGERGQHDELMARGGRYHKLYTVQARI